MNLVLDDAEEVNEKKQTRKKLGISFLIYCFKGRILFKGENITLIRSVT